MERNIIDVKAHQKKCLTEIMTWDEMVSRVENNELVCPEGRKSRASTKNDRSSDWDLGVGWEGAVELMKSGWNESTKQYKVRDEPLGDFKRPEYLHDYCGDEVDIGRFLSGEAECFLNPQLNENTGIKPVVNIACDYGASCYVDASRMVRRGKAVLAVINALEQAGKSVGVWALHYSTRGGHTPHAWSLIEVKASDQYVPVSRLVYAMAHPSMLRRIGFRIMEQWPEEIFSPISCGYGTPLRDDKIPQELPLPAWIDYVSPSLHVEKEGFYDTDANAEKEVKRVLKDIFKLELE